MLSKDQFNLWLAEKRIAVIDGALATELEARGHDLNHPLWSGKTLKDSPDSIQAVHLDYFLAGADIAITASYQITPATLAEKLEMSVEMGYALIKQSVHIAQEARQIAYEKGVDPKRKLLVAGSVGPFGASLADGSEYRGDYVRTRVEFQAFHRPRIQALLDAEVDLLALETMPSLAEIEAIAALLTDEFSNVIAWVSCTTRDAEHLSDGTPWSSVLDVVRRCGDNVVAIGVNCVPMNGVTATLQCIARYTSVPLLCYPNSGEAWDAVTKTWHGTNPNAVLQLRESDTNGPSAPRTAKASIEKFAPIQEWTNVGARLIGGCCRMGPAFIHALDSCVRDDH